MKNLSIKYGIAAALGLMVALIAAISALGFYQGNQSYKSMLELGDLAARQANVANRIEVRMMETRLYLIRYTEAVNSNNPQGAAQELERMQRSFARAEERFAAFNAFEIDENLQRGPLMQAVRRQYETLVTADFRRAIASGDTAALVGHRARIYGLYDEFTESLRSFITFAEQRSVEILDDAERSGNIASIIALTLLVISIAIYIAVQVGLNRLVVQPLLALIVTCQRITKGDLTIDVEDRGNNELGQLYKAMQDMQVNLRNIISTLSSTSETVASSSQQIAGSSEELASRTEEQASALQQTAASMEEISSTVRQNSDTAGEAEALTTDAAQRAEKGSNDVLRTAELMRELELSSRKVHEIVQVIDSIAFQTNILALNASVEAARAGEHGRGFAVVASEVRNLASKTSDSSRTIRNMIEDISERIASGAEQATLSGEGMASIMDGVNRVNAMMKEIALAAKEQESGVSQVSEAITEMDSVTQENVSLVAENNNAASTLRIEAQRLAEIVAFFKVSLHQQAPTRPSQQRLPINGESLRRPALTSTAKSAANDWESF